MTTQTHSAPTQVGPVITKGDLVLDFGIHNQEIAADFLQALLNNNVTIAYEGQQL